MNNCCFELNKSLFNIDGGGGCENYEEVANYAALPVSGDEDTTYKTLDDGKIFEWNGTEYVELVEQSTPIGATLMKSGQTVSYRTGDDGDIEAGRSTSFLVLADNNPFGNTNRFTDELGGQTYTNNIMIDWSNYNGTNVLGYKRTLEALKTWNDAVTDALAISIGSYTSGWRLANMREVFNIFCFDDTLDRMTSYAPLSISTTENVWTGNTYRMGSNAFRVDNLSCSFAAYSKTGTSAKSFVVRTFTVTGTTLT